MTKPLQQSQLSKLTATKTFKLNIRVRAVIKEIAKYVVSTVTVPAVAHNTKHRVPTQITLLVT